MLDRCRPGGRRWRGKHSFAVVILVTTVAHIRVRARSKGLTLHSGDLTAALSRRRWLLLGVSSSSVAGRRTCSGRC